MITIYADGSALGTPGPGGWAFIVQNADGTKVSRCGAVDNVTNNQMELMAAINALLFVDRNAKGVIRCDSQYVVKGVNEWRKGWEKKGMRKADGSAVLNAGYWKDLFKAVDSHPGIRFEWVKGHADDQGNNDVDLLARSAAETLRNSPSDAQRLDPSPAPVPLKVVPRSSKLPPMTEDQIEPAILQAMTKLQCDMEKLTQLSQIGESQGWEAVKGMFGDKAGSWVLRHNISIGGAPIDFILDGRDETVVKLITHIEHGVYA